MTTWKGLKKNIENLIEDTLDLQIHATSYKIKGKFEVSYPRHWVTLNR